jgi:hypothetical protein
MPTRTTPPFDQEPDDHNAPQPAHAPSLAEGTTTKAQAEKHKAL